jgi:C4-dicarboxylate transporter, DctM subunit
MVYAYKKHGEVTTEEKSSWSERLQKLSAGYWGLIIPIGIMASIYTGFATPTEAAAVGCLLAFLATVFFHRTVTMKDFLPILKEGIISASSIMLIITGAVVFGAFITQSGFAASISNFFIQHNIPLWGFLLITMLIMLVEGCFLEGVAICLIMVPILHPAVLSYNFSLITFAVLMTLNIEIALLTPPIGLNIFVVDSLCKARGIPINFQQIVQGVIPFIFLYLIVMLLVSIYPPLSLWLPAQMMR